MDVIDNPCPNASQIMLVKGHEFLFIYHLFIDLLLINVFVHLFAIYYSFSYYSFNIHSLFISY